MAALKRVVLTERNNTVKETVVDKSVNNSVKKQLDKFDNSYTSKKLRELYNEFDSITFDVPTISSSVLTDSVSQTKLKNEVEFKTKVYLSTAILVTLLLAFLVIFNIFVINGLNSGIKILQDDVFTSQRELVNLQDNYDYLSNPENISNRIGNDYVELSSNSAIEINHTQVTRLDGLSYEGNWFDAFCDFVRGIFGG